MSIHIDPDDTLGVAIGKVHRHYDELESRGAHAAWRQNRALAGFDAKVSRCPCCDALVLPGGVMRVRHECTRTTGRVAA